MATDDADTGHGHDLVAPRGMKAGRFQIDGDAIGAAQKRIDGPARQKPLEHRQHLRSMAETNL